MKRGARAWTMAVLGVAGACGWIFALMALIPNAWLVAWLSP